MLKVCKFGGSSLSDAKHFKQVKAIIEADKDRKCVIVSAPGKGEGERDKITDLLYLCFQHNNYHVEFDSLFERVEQRYLTIKKELNIDYPIENDIKDIKDALKAGEMTEAKLVSRGEYLCAKLLSAYLGYSFLDAKDLIHFKFDGKVDEKKTNEDITKAFSKVEKAVIPGFYGSYPNGDICLFSRGGSDVSASYFAEALDAYLYENFTDVSGFYMADPRIIENPLKINEISYDELRELSYAGAQVLHAETIIPLMEKRIPLEVLNSNHPEEGGTFIKDKAPGNNHLITGLTGKKGFIALTFVKSREYDKLESIRMVLDVFARYKVPVEHIPTSIDSFSVIAEKSKLEDRYFDLVADLKKLPEIVSLSEDDDVALVAIVGSNMAKKSGVSGKILSVFGEEKINIKLIDQGREEINIIVGISNSDFEKSLQALYNRFSGKII